jgi:hypothetical protein
VSRCAIRAKPAQPRLREPAQDEGCSGAQEACGGDRRIGSVGSKRAVDTDVENGRDTIVMAAHGRAGVSALSLGSQTQHALSPSTLPLIVVC